VYAFTKHVRARDITLGMNMEVAELLGSAKLSGYGISFAADNVIQLKYIELEGRLERGISVLKVRGARHSTEADLDQPHMRVAWVEVHLDRRRIGIAWIDAYLARPGVRVARVDAYLARPRIRVGLEDANLFDASALLAWVGLYPLGVSARPETPGTTLETVGPRLETANVRARRIGAWLDQRGAWIGEVGAWLDEVSAIVATIGVIGAAVDANLAKFVVQSSRGNANVAQIGAMVATDDARLEEIRARMRQDNACAGKPAGSRAGGLYGGSGRAPPGARGVYECQLERSPERVHSSYRRRGGAEAAR
jgi:hypothetical protein